jgi:hypothetical protein
MYQLGNLITFHSTNDVDIVKKIEKKGNKVYINDVNINDVKPIPILMKHLLKFGAKINPAHNWEIDYEFDEYEIDEIYFSDFNDEGYIIKGFDDKIIKHVHEFQNFVHAVFDVSLVA